MGFYDLERSVKTSQNISHNFNFIRIIISPQDSSLLDRGRFHVQLNILTFRAIRYGIDVLIKSGEAHQGIKNPAYEGHNGFYSATSTNWLLKGLIYKLCKAQQLHNCIWFFIGYWKLQGCFSMPALFIWTL